MNETAREIVWTRSAANSFDGLPTAAHDALDQATSRLARNPLPSQSRPLAAIAGRHRLRVGSYRVIYELDRASGRIIILAVGHRKDVYR